MTVLADNFWKIRNLFSFVYQGAEKSCCIKLVEAKMIYCLTENSLSDDGLDA